MCQCGCGDTAIDLAFKIERGPTVAYQLYRGCSECFAGIGIMLSFFDKAGAREWCENAPTRNVKPDESGGNRGEFNLPIFDVDDLIAASKDMDTDSINKRNGYRTFQDWLEDKGLALIQGAIRHRAAKAAKEKT